MEIDDGAGLVNLMLLTVIFVSFVTWRQFYCKTSSYPFPPSPPGEPILGHVRLVPTENPELYYHKLSEEYDTDILFFKQFRTPIVVLNTVKAANELLSVRGANYCDRPRFVLFEVMGWGRTLTFLPWGRRFKAHRSHLQTAFTQANVIQYRGLQEQEARQAVSSIVNRFATAIVLKVAFGIEVHDDHDPYIQIAVEATEATGNGGSPGATIVDYFPVLGSLPSWLIPSRAVQHARQWGYAIQSLHDIPFAAARRSFNKDVLTQSYVLPLLKQHAENEAYGVPNHFTMADINGSAAAIFIAGADTTYATTLVGILNLLLNPSVAHKARQLLDDNIGTNRLPCLDDRANPRLRYLEYIIQEVVRWRPLSPLGVPHKSLKDDIYHNMFIPKGTNVYFNTWAMSRDESIYKNPDSFNPDRYLPKEEGGDGEPYLSGPFGFGRRVCIGRHLAMASVWILLATLIATTDINPAIDSEGNEIPPSVKFTTGLSSHLHHFDCRFKVRSEKARSLVETTLS